MHGLPSRDVAKHYGRRKRNESEAGRCLGFAAYFLVKDSLGGGVVLGRRSVAEDCLWHRYGRAVREGEACSVDCTDCVSGGGAGFVTLVLDISG